MGAYINLPLGMPNPIYNTAKTEYLWNTKGQILQFSLSLQNQRLSLEFFDT